MIVGQTFDGRDVTCLDVFYIDNTGTLGFTVDKNRAHTAFGNAAGIFHTCNFKVVSQDL